MEKNNKKLLIGFILSQPQGNYDHVIENAYQHWYKPFFTLLNRFSNIPVTLHVCGNLLQWFEDHHPEVLMLLNDLVKRKQVELLSGGFYSPIFSLIPQADRIGQIEALTTLIRKRFGKRPRGCWITGGIWETPLVTSLNSAGMEFSYIDEKAILSNGCQIQNSFQVWMTEDQGKSLSLIPYHQELSETLLGLKPETAVVKLQSIEIGENPDNFISLFFPVEAINIIWWEKYFQLLSVASNTLEIILPYDIFQNKQRRKLGFFQYVPGHDDLPFFENRSDAQRPGKGINNRSVSVKQMLTRYPEANFLYARMYLSSMLVNQLKGDKFRRMTAQEELWKGQTGYVYLHGKYGWIYNSHLRKEAYRALIEAEKITREIHSFHPGIQMFDFDNDGLEEIIFQGKYYNAFIHLFGGITFELDYLPISWNYLDSLSRLPEPYHDTLISGKGYDRYLRKGFIDHFLDKNERIDKFESNKHQEITTMGSEEYKVKYFDQEKYILILEKAVVLQDKKEVPLHLEKKYEFLSQSLKVTFTITNKHSRREKFNFGSEFNCALASDHIEHTELFKIQRGPNDSQEKSILKNTRSMYNQIQSLQIYDKVNAVILNFTYSEECKLWLIPLTTYSNSRQGLNPQYQATTILPLWTFSLEPGEKKSIQIELKFSLS